MMASTSVVRKVSVYAVTKMSARIAAYTTTTWVLLPTDIRCVLACNHHTHSCQLDAAIVACMLKAHNRHAAQHLGLPACAALQIHRI